MRTSKSMLEPLKECYMFCCLEVVTKKEGGHLFSLLTRGILVTCFLFNSNYFLCYFGLQVLNTVM